MYINKNEVFKLALECSEIYQTYCSKNSYQIEEKKAINQFIRHINYYLSEVDNDFEFLSISLKKQLNDSIKNNKILNIKNYDNFTYTKEENKKLILESKYSFTNFIKLIIPEKDIINSILNYMENLKNKNITLFINNFESGIIYEEIIKNELNYNKDTIQEFNDFFKDPKKRTYINKINDYVRFCLNKKNVPQFGINTFFVYNYKEEFSDYNIYRLHKNDKNKLIDYEQLFINRDWDFKLLFNKVKSDLDFLNDSLNEITDIPVIIEQNKQNKHKI